MSPTGICGEPGYRIPFISLQPVKATLFECDQFLRSVYCLFSIPFCFPNCISNIYLFFGGWGRGEELNILAAIVREIKPSNEK